MTKIDIFSGFLGAGKTTLIKKLIQEGYHGEQLVLIENEFGEIGIDGGFLKEAGIQINEMNSGCICCSLVGDFRQALMKVLDEYHPDRIIIEPSGVGKLSDVINAVKTVASEDVVLNSFITVADATKCKIYMKNFGEFYNNQIESASTIILSRTQNVSDEKLSQVLDLLREHNQKAAIVTTPWDALTGDQILAATEGKALLTVDDVVYEEECDDPECECHHHHHHDHDDDDDHEHEHHHHHHDHDDDDDHEHEHHHHHHDHDDDDDHEHEHHHHHHDHDDDHEHHHHHHHHADEVFISWGKETAKKYTKEDIQRMLAALTEQERYGMVLRAKGILAAQDGTWIHFDYVPGESDVRSGSADYTGRICVIGSKLNETALAELFGV
ncbi:MAG: CobW family GTP-binding protein [Acutalibacteraceae bacterium]|nr:CobW family GTP-binding protein [Acutalibacteraceae bacterium]